MKGKEEQNLKFTFACFIVVSGGKWAVYRCVNLCWILITCDSGALEVTTCSSPCVPRRLAMLSVPFASVPFQRLISCFGVAFFGLAVLSTSGTCTATSH